MPTRRTLLLADDSPTIRKVVSLTFEDEGLRVVTVGSGGEALAELERDAPDVILADVHMPAPGGYELCARVKRDERLRHVPVMLLVGAFEPFDEAEARKVGADEVLTKPFQSIRDLVSKVGGLLGGQPEAKKPDEAHAAEPRGESGDWDARRAPSREAATPAAAQSDATGAPAFAGFDFDDESIETVSADSFAARAEATAQEVRDVEATPFAREESAPAGRASAPFEFGEPAAPSPAAQESRSFAAAASGFSAPARAPFDSRPPAEDSLLDLDEVDDAPAAESDDFVLDMGDEPAFARSAPATFDAEPRPEAAPRVDEIVDFEEVTLFGEAAPVEEAAAHAGEPPAGVSPANLSSAWREFGHAEVTTHEEAPAGLAAPDFDGDETTQTFAPLDFEIAPANSEAAAPAAFASAAPAEIEELEEAGPLEAGQPEPDRFGAAPAGPAEESAARGAAAESDATWVREPSQAGGAQLSQETIDAIARRVVEQMSDRVLREIAWEVVPDLAERLIRQRLDEQK